VSENFLYLISAIFMRCQSPNSISVQKLSAVSNKRPKLELNHVMIVKSVKDIPAQWAKIRQGLDIFRISSICVCLSDGGV